jgi:rhodanese-related sulfurtransferase
MAMHSARYTAVLLRAPLVLAALLVGAVALANPPLPDVSGAKLQARIDAGDHDVAVLDVRSPEEYAAGHVPGALNIPFDQVAQRHAEVPKDKDVVLYCRSGRRAGIAAEALAAQGYTRLQHLEGDMPAWIEQGRPVEKPEPGACAVETPAAADASAPGACRAD